MVTVSQLVVGTAGVVLGLAWVLAPLRMSRYQNRLRVWGSPDEYEPAERLEWVGRLGGVVLAALGAAFLAGVVP
jgi:hypothetical protein